MSQWPTFKDMMTDSEFLFGVHKAIGYLVDQGVTVYHYILTHKGQFSITQLNGVPETVGSIKFLGVQYIDRGENKKKT